MSYPHFPDPRDAIERGAMQHSYTLPGPYFSTTTTDLRIDSSSSSMRSTSSLSGAVDHHHVPAPSDNSPSHPHKTRSLFSLHSQSSWDSQLEEVAWPSSYPPDRATPMYQRHSPESPPELTYTHHPAQGVSPSTYSEPSPPIDSPTPSLLFSSTFPSQTSFQSDRTTQGVSMVPSPSGSSQTDYRSPHGRLEEEVRALRKQKRDLEFMYERSRIRISDLERVLARGNPTLSPRRSGDPLIPHSPAQNSRNRSSMEMSFKARTEARTQLLCSSNRAGNALCSWHDSRRERRAYPPRMAPPGYLNCGCTYEEALFEESLSRHGVGSYRPGETVRMDPALRRPLLRLLQQRYHYRDGDFERHPQLDEWVQGEGHLLWEQKLASSVPSTRKARKEDRDRR